MQLPETQSLDSLQRAEGLSSFEFVTYPNGQKAANKHKIYWHNEDDLLAKIRSSLLAESKLAQIQQELMHADDAMDPERVEDEQ